MSKPFLNRYATRLWQLFLQPFIDICFPPICFKCENLLANSRKIICLDCWQKIPRFKTHTKNKLISLNINHAYILFEFERTVQHLIHLLKYEHHLTLASYFALEISNCFPSLCPNNYDVIVPVPLFRTRRRERGYNQTEEIAKNLSRCTMIHLETEYLLRVKSTRTQTQMTRQERRINVMNAFVCPTDLTGKRILLLDDVITTGSTVNACIKSLVKAGAKKVDVLAIAHPRKLA